VACECGEPEYLAGRCKRHHDAAWHRSRGKYWVRGRETAWPDAPAGLTLVRSYYGPKKSTIWFPNDWAVHNTAALFEKHFGFVRTTVPEPITFPIEPWSLAECTQSSAGPILGDPRWSVNPFSTLWDNAARFGSDEIEDAEWRRIVRRNLVRWLLGPPRSWTTSQCVHPLVFQPLFVTNSYPPDKSELDPVGAPQCREHWRNGFTIMAVDDPVRPWQRSWRLCEVDSTKERRYRSRPRSHVPCAACGYRFDRRKGGALDEAFYQAWRRARKEGISWATFARVRETRERARRIIEILECEWNIECTMMSLARGDVTGDISPAWRAYLKRAIGANHKHDVTLKLEGRAGIWCALTGPVAGPIFHPQLLFSAETFSFSSHSTTYP
jgi:hypothetical protein